MVELNKINLAKTTLDTLNDDRSFFHVCRGDRLTNIKDMANCIESLNENEFETHVNEEKNDFASWICHSLNNPFLARDLDSDLNKKDKEHYVKTIRDHINWLEN